jgi:hypothetical protein
MKSNLKTLISCDFIIGIFTKSNGSSTFVPASYFTKKFLISIIYTMKNERRTVSIRGKNIYT